MFTGIIEGTATVSSIQQYDSNATKLKMDMINYSSNMNIGQSVSLNGACLSITNIIKNRYHEFELTKETISRTTFANIKTGDKINVERSLKIGDRLDGHFVLGHVDCVSKVLKLQKMQSETKIWFDIPQQLRKYIVSKGSIAIDGVSLTIVDDLVNEFSVCIIPQTLLNTNFNTKTIGDEVNVEIDILAKHIHKNNNLFTGNY
ncbi:MAG: riboflavin synthase [Nitrosopumilaceae archaeon]|nr:riboflavin synthase [Nitrosopumilaceae archaeon]